MNKISKTHLYNTFVGILSASLIFAMFSMPMMDRNLTTKAEAATTNIANNSCYSNDVINAVCLTALNTSIVGFAISKGDHIDAAFTPTSLTGSTITSATIFYKASGTLSGTWGIYVKDARDGTTICSVDPAPEPASYTVQSFACNSVTADQLTNGVWLYAINNDTAAPQSITVGNVYITVNYTPAASIVLNTDGMVPFGTRNLNSTINSTASGVNDVQTVTVDSGPANLTVRSSNFSDGSNIWTLGNSAGVDAVKWEYSLNGTTWNTFVVPNTLYTFDSNVATSQTRNLYLQLTLPSSTSSFLQHSSAVTIVATSP